MAKPGKMHQPASDAAIKGNPKAAIEQAIEKAES